MRCYNGAPDTELQALLDYRAALRRQLETRGARICYFPMEQMWQVYSTDHKPLGVMSESFEEACNSAMEKLR